MDIIGTDPNGSRIVLSQTDIIIAETTGSQLRAEQSKSGTVEEDGIMSFAISLIDIDSGAIAGGDIDITGISAVLEKSTGGAAFSAAGITQPTFVKAAGLVSVDYRFLAAEWINGDIYKLEVSGIEAQVNAATVFIKTFVWSNAVIELANIETKIDTNQDLLDGTTPTPTAYRREEGVTQIKEFSITAAANAGLTTVATITDQGCWIEGIVEHSDGATTTDLTSAAIKGGASQVVEFISAVVAIRVDIDAENKQVGWDGAVWLPAGATIVIDLQGTGATAVDLTVPIKYRSSVDGGYLA